MLTSAPAREGGWCRFVFIQLEYENYEQSQDRMVPKESFRPYQAGYVAPGKRGEATQHFFFWNLTNAEQFVAGSAPPRLEHVGPYVFDISSKVHHAEFYQEGHVEEGHVEEGEGEGHVEGVRVAVKRYARFDPLRTAQECPRCSLSDTITSGNRVYLQAVQQAGSEFNLLTSFGPATFTRMLDSIEQGILKLQAVRAWVATTPHAPHLSIRDMHRATRATLPPHAQRQSAVVLHVWHCSLASLSRRATQHASWRWCNGRTVRLPTVAPCSIYPARLPHNSLWRCASGCPRTTSLSQASPWTWHSR